MVIISKAVATVIMAIVIIEMVMETAIRRSNSRQQGKINIEVSEGARPE